MKNSKFLYIYTDQDKMIKEIATSIKDMSELNEYLIPINQGTEFLALKEKWNQSYGYRSPHILLSDDGKYYAKEIVYVYYEKRKNVIKSISSTTQDYLDNNSELLRGMAKRSSLTDSFMDKKPFHNYKVKVENSLLEFIENIVSLDDTLKDVSLLKDFKIEFVKQDSWVKIIYNRKRKEIEISRLNDLGIGELYFSKKNDSTILYTSIKVEYEPKKAKFRNIILPTEFDIYNLRDERNRFSYEEI